MKITVRPTTENEAEELCRLQQAAFKPLYEKYKDDGSPALRGIEDIIGKMNSPVHKYFTIFLDGEIVGGIVYKCKGAAVFDRTLGEGEYYLNRVYIRPDIQSKGVAKTAILLCEKEFTDARKFYVDFPADLDKNRRCYENAGYVDSGKRITIQEGLSLAFYEKQV